MYVIQCETKTFVTKRKKVMYIGDMHNVKDVKKALTFSSERVASNFMKIHELDRNLWKVRKV